MSTPVATRPPFPFQGTLSIEGTRINAPVTSADRLLPTLPREPIDRMLKIGRCYLAGCEPDDPAHGKVMMVRGEHGTGKTHALKHLMETLLRDPQNNCAPVHQIYVKAEGPDFIKLYQEAAALVPAELLRDLSLRFLGLMATEQLQSAAGQQSASGTQESPNAIVEKRLRSDPQQVYELFSQYQVEAGAAEERRSQEVERVAGGVRDFNRALSYLLSSELATAAYDWLLGRPVATELMERLGVSGPIVSPTVAKWALQLLVTLFGRAGRPLIVYIDQFEKLVLNGNELLTQNAGLLHTLVEFVPRAGCMLVVCGSNKAWQALPGDLQQRFGANVIECPVLKLQEAKDLIRLYMTPSGQAFEPGATNEDDLHPFDEDAIRQIMRFSSGNPRRFLQICAEAWQLSGRGSTTITPQQVEQAVKQISALAYFDEHTVRTQIADMLTQRGMLFSEGAKLGGGQVTFAARTAQNALRLVIDVKGAFFHYDEALRALDSLNLRAQLAKEKIPARYVLVVLGYVSPEIVEQVRGFVHELIVYEPESFRARFERVLEQVPTVLPADESTVRTDELERQLGALRSTLEKIASSRGADADVIEQRISKLLEKQGSDRLADRQQSAREAWSAERKQIEDRIRSVRAARAAADLEEIRRAVENADNQTTKRQRVIGLLGGIYAGAGPVIYALEASRLGAFWLLVGVVLVVLGALLPEWLRLLTPWRQELRTPPASLEELERMARKLTKDRSDVEAMLRKRYPQWRYAGALVAHEPADFEPLLSALYAEPTAVVRRTFAKCIGRLGHLALGGRKGPLGGRQAPEDLLARVRNAPEMGYIVQTWIFDDLPFDEVHELPAPLATLVAVTGAPPPTPLHHSMAFDLAVGLQRDPRNREQAVLAEAFEQGPDRYLWPADMQFGPQWISDALAELSPFDAGGLGMLDELQNIKRIDQMYLFFRHLEFLLERDLLWSSTAKTQSRRQPAA